MGAATGAAVFFVGWSFDKNPSQLPDAGGFWVGWVFVDFEMAQPEHAVSIKMPAKMVRQMPGSFDF